MAKKDYKAMAAGIIKQAGGADNIVSATHCMTRLRLVLRDRSKFDTDAVKQVPGVLNVIIQNGEYQVVPICSIATTASTTLPRVLMPR